MRILVNILSEMLLIILLCHQMSVYGYGAIKMTKEKSFEKLEPHFDSPYSECQQDDLLGMISGAITDAQVSASSFVPEHLIKGCHPRNARPYTQNGLAWCPNHKASTEWLQIDLGARAIITGILIQGRGDGKEWVQTFTVSYSDDGAFWTTILNQYGNQKLFEGNTESFKARHSYLDKPIQARFVRIHPFTWSRHPSLRAELIGCQPCKQLLGTPPYTRFAASSSRYRRNARSCSAEDGHYLSNKAWCALRQNTMQWFQMDIGPPTQITGIVLRPRGDGKWLQYVTRFKLSYSNDSHLWFFYKDASYMDPKVFIGNTEQVQERIHYLAAPIIARYFRVHPVTWRGRIAMRVGLLGCRHKGPCEPGFFRVNDKSSCIANLAYKKEAWMSNNPDNPKNKPTENKLPSSIYIPSYSPQLRYHQITQMPTTQSFFAVPLREIESHVTPRHSYNGSDNGNSIETSSTPLHDWNSNDVMLSDSAYNRGDEYANRAVDGYTGEEAIDSLTLDMGDKGSFFVEFQSDGVNLNDQTREDRKGKHKRASRSIIGALHPCTILKYIWPYENIPVWHVDLQETFEISGIVIYTAGHGREPYSSLIAESLDDASKFVIPVNNLERLSVYIEPETSSASISERHFCGHVTRTNNAVFLVRQHIMCQRQITGRYVYVEAQGLRSPWPKDFLAALCEVQIY